MRLRLARSACLRLTLRGSTGVDGTTGKLRGTPRRPGFRRHQRRGWSPQAASPAELLHQCNNRADAGRGLLSLRGAWRRCFQGNACSARRSSPQCGARRPQVRATAFCRAQSAIANLLFSKRFVRCRLGAGACEPRTISSTIRTERRPPWTDAAASTADKQRRAHPRPTNGGAA